MPVIAPSVVHSAAHSPHTSVPNLPRCPSRERSRKPRHYSAQHHHTPPYTTIHHHTPPYNHLHPVLFLYELRRWPFEKLRRLKMTQYAQLDLGSHMHNFKRHETKKYRDGVCRSLECKFAPIDPDGNCFFAAVSTAMAHFYDQPLSITALDLRARVVAWLIDCKVRALPPTHHHTPPQ